LATTPPSLSPLDVAFVALYFVGVAAIGVWSSRRSLADSRSYFLGGGSIGWMAIGASLFASNISAEHFIGLAGSGAESGLAVAQFEWLACLILLLLGWFFVPFYMRSGVYTMPEFLERRYNRHCRTYLSAISLVAYVFTKVSVAVYAGALVLNTILGWNIWIGAIVLILATGAYTVFGGLRAVVYTDFFQGFVLIGGGIFLTVAAVSRAGGLDVVLSEVPAGFMSVWRPMSDPDFPWTGILLGAPILGIWYWCTDQMIVQRTLAARGIADARKASIFAGYLKILPAFILVLPGIAGRILLPDTPPDRIYAQLVSDLLAPGIRGLVVAALLAALMSSLSSVFNSSSTLVVMDFYKRFKPDASEGALVRAGQVSTIGLVFVGLLWLPFIGLMSDQIYIYLQSVQAYISPPIAAVFLVGLLWRPANGKGALTTLVTGFVIGAFRFVAEIAVKAGWVDSGFLVDLAAINFLHFAVLLFAISVVVLVVGSLLTRATAEPSSLDRLKENATGVTTVDTDRKRNIILSAVLVGIVAVLWLIFSPLVFG